MGTRAQWVDDYDLAACLQHVERTACVRACLKRPGGRQQAYVYTVYVSQWVNETCTLSALYVLVRFTFHV